MLTSERIGPGGLAMRMAVRQGGRLWARILFLALCSLPLVGALLVGQGIAREGLSLIHI